MILEYYKIHKESIDPIRANPSDAGMDVFYCPKPSSTKEIKLYPNTSILLGTGLKFGIPHGYMLEVKNRSSWASKKSLIVGACVIDSGYNGEVMINLHNIGSEVQVISPGDKIAQIIMVPVIHFRPRAITNDQLYNDDLCISNRGSGGFGSTG
jgi:dUTP pyrophosphatase